MINAGDYNKKISIYQIEELEDNDGFITKGDANKSIDSNKVLFRAFI